MNITYLNQWLSDREVKAICWTLIHSLWQGLLIAALAGLVIAATRKAPARVRYQLFCMLLVIFMLTVGCTFIYELGWSTAAAAASTVLNINTVGRITADTGLNGRASLLYTITCFLNSQAAGIFAIWVICFVYKSAKLLGGIFYIHRIRTQRTIAAPEVLKDKITNFAQRMGIRKQVGIIQSQIVKVPVTLGYLKPLIILPAGIIFQLSTEQIETILWHELAHIRRRDYLVNILQSVVEVIFFFNPAILWLSALIREEREACCDDIVLANVQQKGSYLEALMAFQGQYASAGSWAMALSLRPNQLMNRLRRMVYQENKKLSVLEMSVLLCGLLMFSAFTFIPQAKPTFKNSVAFIKQTITYTFPEALPRKLVERKYIPQKKQVVDTIAVESIPVTIQVDTAIVFKSIRYKKSNNDRANREMNVVDGQDNHYHIIIANSQITTLLVNDKAIAEADFDKYQGLIKQIDAVMDSKPKHAPEQFAHVPNPAKKHRVDTGQTKPLTGLKKENKTIRQRDTAFAASNPKLKKQMPRIDISADQARVRGVLGELVKAGVVANAMDVESFGLSDTQLMVNGKTQPEPLQRKLAQTYGIKPNFGLYYGPVQMHGSGIILDKRDVRIP